MTEPVRQLHSLRRHLHVHVQRPASDEAFAVAGDPDGAIDEQKGGVADGHDEQERRQRIAGAHSARWCLTTHITPPIDSRYIDKR